MDYNHSTYTTPKVSNSAALLVIDVCLLALLGCTAVAVVRMRDLFAAAMLTGIYSFLGASWMLILDAPDVAFTEAAVGAGISTVLMLGTIALTTRVTSPPKRNRLVALVVVTLTGAALVYGTLDMPHFGDPQAPIHTHPNPSYITKSMLDTSGHSTPSQDDIAEQSAPADHVDAAHAISESASTAHDDSHGIPNVVTVVLASYRGYDTLGETTVVFTAGIAVLLLLRGRQKEATS